MELQHRDARITALECKIQGGRTRLLGISKRGDRYLWRLLLHVARAVVRRAAYKKDARSRWVQAIKGRYGPLITSVAVANKHARIFWALPARSTDYRPAA